MWFYYLSYSCGRRKQNKKNIQKLKTLIWKPPLESLIKMAQKNPNSKGAGKLRVVTTSNFHMAMASPGEEFLPITLQILWCILWLKFRKQNNKHLELKHEHIPLRESSITMCYSLLKGKETALATFSSPPGAELPNTVSFMQAPKHGPNNTDWRWWKENQGQISNLKTCCFWALILVQW